MKKVLLACIFGIFVLFNSMLFAAPSVPSMAALPVGTHYYAPTPTVIALPADTWVDAFVLPAASAVTYTVPTGAKYLLFSGTGLFYVSFTGTASIPSTTVADGSAPILGPVLRAVTAGTTVSIISPTAGTVVTISSFR